MEIFYLLLNFNSKKTCTWSSIGLQIHLWGYFCSKKTTSGIMFRYTIVNTSDTLSYLGYNQTLSTFLEFFWSFIPFTHSLQISSKQVISYWFYFDQEMSTFSLTFCTRKYYSYDKETMSAYEINYSIQIVTKVKLVAVLFNVMCRVTLVRKYGAHAASQKR